MAKRVAMTITLLAAALTATLLAGVLLGAGSGGRAGATETTTGVTNPLITARSIPQPVITSPPSSPPTAPASTAPVSTRATTPATSNRTVPATAPRYSPPPSRTYYPGVTTPVVITAPATSTTLAGIGGKLPVAPSTLPLTTKGTSAHVNPIFAVLSGVGSGVALLIVAGRLFVTRPGGRDRRPVERPAR